jgi:LacI family transcriptional regulator
MAQGITQALWIFAVHDPLGRFLSSACSQLGIRVPDDVAIVGANNDPVGLWTDLPKTIQCIDSLGSFWAVCGEFHAENGKGETGFKRTLKLISPSSVVLRHSANHLAVRDKIPARSCPLCQNGLRSPLLLRSFVTISESPGGVWKGNLRLPSIAHLGRCFVR